jgi:DNA mismatch endonuclease, patch repair protein
MIRPNKRPGFRRPGEHQVPDSHTPEQRSYNMSRIRSTGSKAETRLGELLRIMFPGEDIVEHPSSLPGKPDWWLPGRRLALFADGCFFHRCPLHFILPLNNQDYWERKIAGNCARDRRVNQDIRRLGLRPVRIWEHDLRTNLPAVRRKIRRAARIAMATVASIAQAGGSSTTVNLNGTDNSERVAGQAS